MLEEKIKKSVKALKLAAEMSRTYYEKPLIICYSGGKDSDVLLHLAESCLTPDQFEVLNSHTTVDAPETVYHIQEQFDRLNMGGSIRKCRKNIGKRFPGISIRTIENRLTVNRLRCGI